MTILEKNLEQIVAKGGIKSKADAMRKANYSPRTARTPKKSKIWPKLLEKYLPDDGLLTVTQEALKANRKRAEVVDRDSKGAPIYEYFDEEDHATRLKAAEQGYKLKNKYPKEGGININEAKVLVMHSELITKYGLPSSASDSSK